MKTTWHSVGKFFICRKEVLGELEDEGAVYPMEQINLSEKAFFKAKKRFIDFPWILLFCRRGSPIWEFSNLLKGRSVGALSRKLTNGKRMRMGKQTIRDGARAHGDCMRKWKTSNSVWLDCWGVWERVNFGGPGCYKTYELCDHSNHVVSALNFCRNFKSFTSMQISFI